MRTEKDTPARFRIAYPKIHAHHRPREQLNAKEQRREDAKQTLAYSTSGGSMTENEISRIIVESAIEVHRTLGGPGLLESVYEEALAHELTERGLPLERQVSAPVTYKGERLSLALRIDMLVAEKVIIECKATQKYDKIFESQALTYLRIRDLRLALVINFGESLARKGIHRVVNRIRDD